jgi:hypothetical protein
MGGMVGGGYEESRKNLLPIGRKQSNRYKRMTLSDFSNSPF